MNTENEIVCGADIHRDFLVATMISRKGFKTPRTVFDEPRWPLGI
jgi:hypothetical protein